MSRLLPLHVSEKMSSMCETECSRNSISLLRHGFDVSFDHDVHHPGAAGPTTGGSDIKSSDEFPSSFFTMVVSMFFFFFAQDWYVRYSAEISHCVQSAQATAALPAAPPRPQTQAN